MFDDQQIIARKSRVRVNPEKPLWPIVRFRIGDSNIRRRSRQFLHVGVDTGGHYWLQSRESEIRFMGETRLAFSEDGNPSGGSPD